MQDIDKQSDHGQEPDTSNVLRGDLSLGDLPDNVARTKVGLGLEEHSHRLRLQTSVTNSALSFVALLFLVAVFFGGALLYLLVEKPGWNIHWHASILVAAFVVPPTVVLVAILRAVYSPKEGEKEQAMMPIFSLIKDAVVSVAELFKKG